MNRREALKASLLLAPFALRVQAKARLEKKRPCDGVCCHESPLRRPEITQARSSGTLPDGCEACVFHSHTLQFDVNSGCRIMQDARLLDELTEDELRRFAENCVGYPIPYEPTGGFGNCCWGKA